VDEEIRFFFINDAKVLDLSPEIVCMGADSVNAMVFC
jgi:hypothetical protein